MFYKWCHSLKAACPIERAFSAFPFVCVHFLQNWKSCPGILAALFSLLGPGHQKGLSLGQASRTRPKRWKLFHLHRLLVKPLLWNCTIQAESVPKNSCRPSRSCRTSGSPRPAMSPAADYSHEVKDKQENQHRSGNEMRPVHTTEESWP